jgi:hypothetical protein
MPRGGPKLEQLFFSSLTDLSFKQPLSSLREILSGRKKKGRGGGGAANSKKIKFLKLNLLKIQFFVFIFLGKKGKSSNISRKKKGCNL